MNNVAIMSAVGKWFVILALFGVYAGLVFEKLASADGLVSTIVMALSGLGVYHASGAGKASKSGSDNA